jgi:ABC-2 type transport system ATP-binding protein
VPENVAIVVDHVSKRFLLPHERKQSLKSVFMGIVRKRNKSVEIQRALDDISLEIKKGEFFGIVGRNGSGKSTLLKMLAGIYQPTSGKIITAGKLVPFIELGVGFNPELTGRENVYLNGAMLGFSTKQIDAMYDGIVEFAELGNFMDQKLKNYSSGMQVRLAFSMATRSEADILLVDEVLAVGDAAFQKKCFEYFMLLKKNKKTVVFVSHDMGAIRQYCDKAILIEKSKIIASGSADKISGLYSKLFLESSSANVEEGDAANRWGDNAAQYKKVDVEVTKDTITVTASAVVNKDIEKPVFGFLIRNYGGSGMLGTNSHIKKHRIKKLKAGDTVNLTWTLSNILNDGTYFVEPAIEYGALVTADWWEDAAKFVVTQEEKTSYVVSPPIQLDLQLGK